nr:hypothetical protein KPHV_14990 [Kitasatospora purpeofusca]
MVEREVLALPLLDRLELGLLDPVCVAVHQRRRAEVHDVAHHRGHHAADEAARGHGELVVLAEDEVVEALAEHVLGAGLDVVAERQAELEHLVALGQTVGQVRQVLAQRTDLMTRQPLSGIALQDGA